MSITLTTVPGENIIASINHKSHVQLELGLVNAILHGKHPTWWSKVPITFAQGNPLKGEDVHSVTLFVYCDYAVVGDNSGWVYVPLLASHAMKLAFELDCVLPTKKIVDIIWHASACKLMQHNLPPDSNMATVKKYVEHSQAIIDEKCTSNFFGEVLVAGHKKDIVIVGETLVPKDRVTIYGWHGKTGDALQPLHSGHSIGYVDYSHGVRLISQDCIVDGENTRIRELSRDKMFEDLFGGSYDITGAYV